MQKIDWDLKYLKRLTLVTFTAAGLAVFCKLYFEGWEIGREIDYWRELLSFPIGGLIVLTVTYGGHIFAQIFKK